MRKIRQLSTICTTSVNKIQVRQNSTSSGLNTDNIEKIIVKDNIKSNDACIEASGELSVNICNELNCRYVDFVVVIDDVQTPPSVLPTGNACTSNAFNIMMKAQKESRLPPKPSLTHTGKQLPGPQRIYCDLLDWASDFDDGWTQDLIESGKTVFGKLSAALWFLDPHHKKFENNGCPVPAVFKKFQGYNNFSKFHHKAPIVTADKLSEICIDLSSCLSIPSMMSRKHEKLSGHIEELLKCISKYKERLEKDNYRQKHVYQARTESAFSMDTDSTNVFIQGKTNIAKDYEVLDEKLRELHHYQYLELDELAPSDREKRRKYIKNLQSSKSLMLFRLSYGGRIGTLNFVWTVPDDDTQNRAENNSRVISDISKTLPKFSTRAMRRDFINKYISHVNTPKAVLRHMYHELTNSVPAPENQQQRDVDERVAEILMSGDDSELLLDNRSLNGKDIDDRFGEFFEEVGKYFDEQLMAVHERRHGDELYLPLAISVEDLKNTIVSRLPDGTQVPSTETLRLQFMPSNPFHKTSLRYTGRFNVKFRVQTRQARVNHVDGRYVATMFKYLKEFCVKYRDEAIFVCLDDKAIIPVGDPGVPISTGVRGHNKVLAPASGPSLVAADHDFHVGGIVPSVALVTTTPSTSNDSFFQGKVFVTTKDKVFEASTPFRHATELTKLLRDNFSDDDVNLHVPILCIMTDGGPDHRVTYESVKTSLMQLFMQLDLDMLVAIRTAPNHSWLNPAERCMSILNLALQHVALDRKEMDQQCEALIKHKNSLNAIRNASKGNPQLKEAFSESMSSVIDAVNDRFSRMKLKEEPIITYKGASDLEIESCFNIVKETTSATGVDTNSSSKDFKESKQIQDFLRTHAFSSHYTFQIKKCKQENCGYCTINPVRMNKEQYEGLSFLPCPVPDESGQHYLKFDELYGKEIDDTHRPSLKNTSNFDDEVVDIDKRNREILKAVKVRDAIHCGECGKPRLVYSASKLCRDQEENLRRIKEENFYICGDEIPDITGCIVRRSLSCKTEIEIAYYGSSVRGYLPPVCVFCGTANDLLDDNHPHISQLYEEYSSVRPLCDVCHRKGLTAKTWGRKFFKKLRKN